MLHVDDDALDAGEETYEDQALIYQRAADRITRQLDEHPPTDPALRAKLERDRDIFQHWAALADAPRHFASGEGDRPLF